MDIASLERARTELQRRCDEQRTQMERNRMGQFATPFLLAREITIESLGYLGPNEPLDFLDPAFGTGAFYSALLNEFPDRVASSIGFEIDNHYGAPSVELWKGTNLQLHIADFTNVQTDKGMVNLLICNPPYVRHHHLSAAVKAKLQRDCKSIGITLSGLAGLYCYFMVLAHRWLRPNAVSAWLVPSEFMGVNYGEAIKDYLLRNVTLLRIHRFDPQEVQFDDALVSSAVVWFRNRKPTKETQVNLSFGGTLARPRRSAMFSIDELWREPKWTRLLHREVRGATEDSVRLGDLFSIKRGLATGDNKFFILTEQQVADLGISRKFLKPILPSPRYLKRDEIEADEHGDPIVSPKLFLIDCPLDERELENADPALADYLKSGARTTANGYLCRSRTIWYSQEHRPPSPILCTYMGREGTEGKPAFRFILNHSQATAANVYLLLYPKPAVRHLLEGADTRQQVFQILRSIPMQHMTGEGRVYGGGLHKLEPRELANVPLPEIANLLPNRPLKGSQGSLGDEFLLR